MQTLRVATAILFVLEHISASLNNEAPKADEYDIEKFLNTSELIWTTNTTAEIRRICQVDLVEHLTQKNVTFYRSYYQKSGWRMSEYFGNFTHFSYFNITTEDPYDSMVVTNERGLHKVTETLHYQSPDNNCAVFWILGSNGYSLQPWYEMRMKDSKIKRGFTYQDDCWKALKDVAHKKIRRVYDSRCQKALDEKYPSPANFKD